MRRAPVARMPTLVEFQPMARHRVVALALEPLVALDLAAPAHVFGHWGGERYSFRVAGADGSPVATSSGFAVDVEAGLGALRRADTVVVPGYEGASRPPPEPVLGELRRAAGRGARVMSICTGAFALAHAGLLDGRRATTHWDSAAIFAAAVPGRAARPGRALRRRGQLLTSAGVAAGLDLCLHVVRRDHGARAGRPDRPADRGGAPPRGRPGAVHRARAPAGDGRGGAARRPRAPGRSSAWSGRSRWPTLPGTPASRSARSPAASAPRPARARINGCCPSACSRPGSCSRSDDVPVDEIARVCGFADAAALRYHFRRAVATTPSAYRRSFSR